MLRPLLSFPDQTACDIITLIGQRSSPKEVIIAVQEVVERIVHVLQEDEEEEDEEEYDENSLSLVRQLVTLASLYSNGASCLPTLQLR